MEIFAIGSLLAGALFYALITAHLDYDLQSWPYLVLVIALLSSLVLALQEAVLNIQNEFAASPTSKDAV